MKTNLNIELNIQKTKLNTIIKVFKENKISIEEYKIQSILIQSKIDIIKKELNT